MLTAANPSSNPSSKVLAWSRQMQLALHQDKSTDHVNIAITHLEGDAASWIDTVLLPAHETQSVLPWPDIETEFKTRFMDRH